MNNRSHGMVIVTALAFALCSGVAWGQVTGDAPGVRPEAIIDLKTDEGLALVKGQWRYSNVKVIDVDHHGPGADLAPSGSPNRTQDIDLHAGAADFDDSKWEMLKPIQLEERRSTGRLCFNWYRTSITIPDGIGPFNPVGSTVVFEVAIDDYAEVWVDGRLPLVLGQPGGQLIKGFNAPNRVVLTRNAKPGQRIQLAVFGINGPLSNPPGNFIWVRSATLDFYKASPIGQAQFVRTEIVKTDPVLDEIVRRPLSLKSSLVAFSSPRDRSGSRPPPMPWDTSSSAIPTPTRSIVGQRKGRYPSFAPRAATAASMSVTIINPARMG